MDVGAALLGCQIAQGAQPDEAGVAAAQGVDGAAVAGGVAGAHGQTLRSQQLIQLAEAQQALFGSRRRREELQHSLDIVGWARCRGGGRRGRGHLRQGQRRAGGALALATGREGQDRQQNKERPETPAHSSLKGFYQFTVHQRTNPPSYQSTNPPIYQSTNLPTYQSTNLPTYQSTNPPIYQSTNLPIYQPANLPTYPNG
jgi:hypothetical protein